MRVTEYKIVQGPTDKIANEINALIKQGWQPFGSPAVLPPSADLAHQFDTIFQAMVRRWTETR